MLKPLVILLFFLFSYINSYSQPDTTLWNDTKVYENDELKIEVPESWLFLPLVTNEKIPFYFQGRATDYPVIVNGNNVFVTILVDKMTKKFNNLDEVTKDIQDGYPTNPDRVFPEGPTSEVETFTIQSGETANIVSTRFYRKSKGLNQSRFDLALYNEQTKNAYMYTLIVLYGDDTYQLEETLKIRDYAKRIFSRFSFKKRYY